MWRARMRRWERRLGILAGVAAFVVLGTGTAVWADDEVIPADGTPDSAALQVSLARETDGFYWPGDVTPCEPAGRDGVSVCSVQEPGHLSGTYEYRVWREGRRCWRARLVFEEGADLRDGPPVRVRGCVMLGDQLWAG